MLAMHYAALLAGSLFSGIASCQKVISLVGNHWELFNPELNISVPAQLPSHAHLDLFASQVIGVSLASFSGEA